MLSRLLGLTLVLSLASCSGNDDDSTVNPPGTTGQGTLNLLATDAPFAYEFVSAANVTIERVSVHEDANEDVAGFVVMYDGPPRVLDLFALRDGLTTQLAQADIRNGSYRQIRVRISAAELTLVNGNKYSTEMGNLEIASQPTAGFQMFVDPPIEIAEGLTRTYLLDFDLSKTFNPTPDTNPLDATSFTMSPVVHVANVATSGEIRGDVMILGLPDSKAVANATVYFLPPGVADLDLSIAVTGSNAAGSFAQLGLRPGTYDVRAVKGDVVGVESNVTVSAGSFTTVHIIHP